MKHPSLFRPHRRPARVTVWLRRALQLLLCLPLAAAAGAAPVQVVASIKPLALMVEEIAGEHVEVSVLVRPGQTPHDFAFKVSDRQRLAQADLLVWVGPSLEPYLAALAPEHEQVSMASVLALANSHGDDKQGHDHAQGHVDQHFWLHPLYGKAMITAIAETLSRLDRANAELYRSNAARIGEQLLAIPAMPAADGRSDEKGHYAVVHQAFDYFLEYFPYPRPIVLTPIPEVSPGARQLWQAGQKLQRGDCLLIESKTPGKWVQTFSARNGLKIRQVDIMGYTEEVNTYTGLLERVKSVFDECARSS